MSAVLAATAGCTVVACPRTWGRLRHCLLMVTWTLNCYYYYYYAMCLKARHYAMCLKSRQGIMLCASSQGKALCYVPQVKTHSIMLCIMLCVFLPLIL